MQANGQYQQGAHPVSSHPYLGHDVNGSYGAYEDNASYNVPRARVGDKSMCNVMLASQRQNNFLASNNPSPNNNLLYYYQNSAQNGSNQNKTPTVIHSQAMLAQKASACANPQSAVPKSNAVYCQSQVVQQHTWNLSQNLRMENGSVPRTNPTSSTIQPLCYTQQSAVQTPMYSQTSQQATYSSPHSQNKNVTFPNPPHVQNDAIYTTTYVRPSCVNNQSVQNNFVSHTNDHRSLPSVNGCSSFSNVMITKNAKGQIHSQSAVPVQTLNCSPQSLEIMQQSLRGIVNLKTTQTVIQGSNDGNGQIYLQKNIIATPIQISVPAKVQSFDSISNSLFCNRINDASNKMTLCAPQNKTSELSRSEAFSMINKESYAQAKDCSLQASPGRAQRAVAVVLPLSQEKTPSKSPTPASPSSLNPSPGLCLDKSTEVEKDNTLDPSHLKQLLQQSPNGSNKMSKDEVNAQDSSPSLKQMESILHNEGTKLSTFSLTFRQLVDGSYLGKLSQPRKSKSNSKKSPKQKKQVEKGPSSVPPTEWTLRMLHKKILELENKENEPISENIHDSSKEIIDTFWNGSNKEILHEASNGPLSEEMVNIKAFCSKIDLNTVVLSQNHRNHSTKYRVLRPGEVYVEKNPYTSSWLNINQLDDIDKEFGLPYFFKYSQNDCRSVNSEKTSNRENHDPIGTKSVVLKPEEEKNKEDYIPLVNNTDNTDEKKCKTPVQLDPDPESRAEESISVSDGPCYSIKIEVLPPEEAKLIYERTESDSPQIMKSSPTEEMSTIDLKNAKTQTCNVTPLKEVCCFEKWQEKVLGLSSVRKCNCEDKDQNEEKLENKSGWLMGIVDLTGYDEIPMFTQGSENNQDDKSPNNSTITVSSEIEDTSQVLEDGCANQTDLEQTEIQEDIGTHINVLQNSNDNDSEMTISEKLLHKVQDCRKYPEESGAETVNPLSSQSVNLNVCENKGNKTFASDGSDTLLCPSKKPKLLSNIKSQTIVESFSKCKNTRVETAELALFGSKYIKCVSDSNQQNQQHDTRSTCEKAEGAPRRVYVKFRNITEGNKKESETSENISAKQRIYEKWKNSLPLSTIRLKRKKKCFAVVNTNHENTIQLKCIKQNDQRAASKRKIQSSDDDQRHKMMRTCNDGGALHMLEKCLQENVLKFDVLPNTFNCKEGLNETGPVTDSEADEKTVSVPAEGSPRLMKTKGAWCDDSTSTSAPESPESTGLFQEFQKLYKMRQASTDE